MWETIKCKKASLPSDEIELDNTNEKSILDDIILDQNPTTLLCQSDQSLIIHTSLVRIESYKLKGNGDIYKSSMEVEENSLVNKTPHRRATRQSDRFSQMCMNKLKKLSIQK